MYNIYVNMYTYYINWAEKCKQEKRKSNTYMDYCVNVKWKQNTKRRITNNLKLKLETLNRVNLNVKVLGASVLSKLVFVHFCVCLCVYMCFFHCFGNLCCSRFVICSWFSLPQFYILKQNDKCTYVAVMFCFFFKNFG